MAGKGSNVVCFSDVYKKYTILKNVDVSTVTKISVLLRMKSVKSLRLNKGKYIANISEGLNHQKNAIHCPVYDVKLFEKELVGPILIMKVNHI